MVASDPQCSRAMHGVHPEPLGEVARRLPVRGYLLHRRALKNFSLRRARLRLTGKPLDALNATRHTPWTYLRQATAKRASASGKLASWFAGWVACHRRMQGLAGCSAELGYGYRNIFWCTGNNCYSHLDEAGEPSGATRDPRERPPRRPTCPDGRGVGSVHFPEGERG